MNIKIIIIFALLLLVNQSVFALETSFFHGFSSLRLGLPLASNTQQYSYSYVNGKENGISIEVAKNFSLSLSKGSADRWDLEKVGQTDPSILQQLLGSDGSIYATKQNQMDTFILVGDYRYFPKAFSINSNMKKISYSIISSIGLLKWNSDVTIDNPLADNYSNTKSGTSFVYGLGGEIVFWRHYLVNTSWYRINLDDTYSDSYKLNFGIRF